MWIELYIGLPSSLVLMSCGLKKADCLAARGYDVAWSIFNSQRGILMLNFAFALMLTFALPQAAEQEQETAQISAEAEAVLEKFIEAKGGRDALEKIENYHFTADLLVDGQKAAMVDVFQAVNRNLYIERLTDGSVRKSGTDGEIAWRVESDDEVQILTGQERRDFMRHNSTIHESLEWINQYESIFHVDKKTIQNQEVDHLIFVAADNRQINRYFSTASGLLIQEEQVVAWNGGSVIQISEISDYRKVNDMVVSHRRINRFGSEFSSEFIMNEHETNTLEDSVFEIPDEVKKVLAKERL